MKPGYIYKNKIIDREYGEFNGKSGDKEFVLKCMIGLSIDHVGRFKSHFEDWKKLPMFAIVNELVVYVDNMEMVEKLLLPSDKRLLNTEWREYISNEDVLKFLDEQGIDYTIQVDNRTKEDFDILLEGMNAVSNSKWDWHLPECIGDWVLERPQGPQTMTIHEDYSLTSDKGPRGKRYPSPNNAFDDAYRFELQSKGLLLEGNDIWYADIRKPRIEENLKLQKELLKGTNKHGPKMRAYRKDNPNIKLGQVMKRKVA